MTTASRQAAPTADDLAYVGRVFPELGQIADAELRDEVAGIWAEVWRESAWERIEDAPKNPNVPGQKLYSHIRSVTLQAVATAEIMKEIHGKDFDRDVLVAGGLLHDVSKLVEYEPKDGGAAKSHRGKLIQHAVYAAHKGWEHGLPEEVVHILVSHTHSSAVRPITWECVVIHYVDYLDSDALLQMAGKPLLLQR